MKNSALVSTMFAGAASKLPNRPSAGHKALFENKFNATHDPKANPIRSLHLNIAFKPKAPEDGSAELPDYGGKLGSNAQTEI